MSVSCEAPTLPNGTLTTQYTRGDCTATPRATATPTVPVPVPPGAGRTVTDVATIWRETVHN